MDMDMESFGFVEVDLFENYVYLVLMPATSTSWAMAKLLVVSAMDETIDFNADN